MVCGELSTVGGLRIGNVKARDLGQWEAGDPAVKEWYQSLMQPENPAAPCCGEADAYWADEVHVRGETPSPLSPTTARTNRAGARTSM